MPASTQKLFVAAAALDTPRPGLRLRDPAARAGGARGTGVIDRLWFVGSGDPVMATDEYVAFVDHTHDARPPCARRLEQLADQIRDRGRAPIAGRDLGDDARYDEPSPGRAAGRPATSTTATSDRSARSRSTTGTAPDGSDVPSDDPAVTRATILTGLLVRPGIRWVPPPGDRPPADASRVAQLTSPPMTRDRLGDAATSDDTTAELITRSSA